MLVQADRDSQKPRRVVPRFKHLTIEDRDSIATLAVGLKDHYYTLENLISEILPALDNTMSSFTLIRDEVDYTTRYKGLRLRFPGSIDAYGSDFICYWEESKKSYDGVTATILWRIQNKYRNSFNASECTDPDILLTWEKLWCLYLSKLHKIGLPGEVDD